eukprot:2469682-Rhodomonas_salina.1
MPVRFTLKIGCLFLVSGWCRRDWEVLQPTKIHLGVVTINGSTNGIDVGNVRVIERTKWMQTTGGARCCSRTRRRPPCSGTRACHVSVGHRIAHSQKGETGTSAVVTRNMFADCQS